MKNKYRIYVDTSVIGGCFDDEFCVESKRLLTAVKKGQVVFVVSDVVVNEIEEAPKKVQNIFKTIPEQFIEVILGTKEVSDLRDAYIEAKIVTQKSKNDAAHVAYATVARVDAIVSWNFRHIVNLGKMKGYNQVNFSNGYGVLEIVSPKEVLFENSEEEI